MARPYFRIIRLRYSSLHDRLKRPGIAGLPPALTSLRPTGSSRTAPAARISSYTSVAALAYRLRTAGF